MKKLWNRVRGWGSARVLLSSFTALLLAAPGFAQAGASPWENAVNVLQQAFTSTIARGLYTKHPLGPAPALGRRVAGG